jgi:very-short-patch-repair endonuclease
MRGKRDHNRRLIAFARDMRKNPTDAEKKLWWLLRRGQLEGFHFRRQVPVAGYIVDFCCLSAGLGVEADGIQHGDDGAVRYDRQRDEALLRKGIRIMRFSDENILKYPQAVQEEIYRRLVETPARSDAPLGKPPPCPPPLGTVGEGE